MSKMNFQTDISRNTTDINFVITTFYFQFMKAIHHFAKQFERLRREHVPFKSSTKIAAIV